MTSNNSGGPRLNLSLQTLGMISGFIGTIIVIVTAWNDVNNKVEAHTKWIDNFENYRKDRSAEQKLVEGANAARFDNIYKDLATLPNMGYRLTQAESNINNISARVERVSADTTAALQRVQGDLNKLATDVALSNQSLGRIELILNGQTPPGYAYRPKTPVPPVVQQQGNAGGP